MGRRVAHLVRGRMLDYIEFEPDFAMVKTNPPQPAPRRPAVQTGVRREHGVTVVAVKSPARRSPTPPPRPSSKPGDTIVVSGATTEVEHFSQLV